MEGRLQPASADYIAETISSYWSLPVITTLRDYMPADVEGLEWVDEQGEPRGLVTWFTEGDDTRVPEVVDGR